MLETFGAVERSPAESFDYCRLDLAPPSGGTVVLRFGELDTVEAATDLAESGAAEDLTIDGPLRAFQEPEQQDLCTRFLLFEDLVTLRVEADTIDSPGTAAGSLCELTTDATDAIVDRLQQDRRIARAERSSTSTGDLGPCGALRTNTADELLAPAPATVRKYPAEHQCRWGENIPSINVRFFPGQSQPIEGATEEVIAGRATAIYNIEIGDRALCLAETTTGAQEVAQVVVRQPLGSRRRAKEFALWHPRSGRTSRTDASTQLVR